jgi:thymidylate synthase
LAEQGLVQKLERNKRSTYSALDPYLIVKDTREKVRKAELAEKLLQELRGSKPGAAEVHMGASGLEYVLEDVLNSLNDGDEYLVSGASGDLFYKLTASYLPTFTEECNKRGIKLRMLLPQGELVSGEVSLQNNVRIQHLPYGSTVLTPTTIYGDKIAHEIIDEQNPEGTAAIIIHNPRVAAAHREQFEGMWELSKLHAAKPQGQERTAKPSDEGRIIFEPELGYASYGKTLGEAWIYAVECVMKNGPLEPDENRDRLALQNFRIKSETQVLPDPILEKYAKMENVEAMIKLVFKSDVMQDFDVTPNFRVGAKSYKKRLEEGNLVQFVVNRLSKIPESKKAVMVFPTYEDYTAVDGSPFNDYLPCIVSAQFRMRPEEGGQRKLNTIFNMRSWNIDQKGAGDLVVISMLNHKICKELSKRLQIDVVPGSIDALITDIHIYQNTFDTAHAAVANFHHDLGK